jgi:hypothetical protein
VNGYLREAVLARADPGHADFEPAAHAHAHAHTAASATPTPTQQLGALPSGHTGGDAADADAAAASCSLPCAALALPSPTPALPPALWECVLRLLSAPDVRAAGAVCTALRQAASSQARVRVRVRGAHCSSEIATASRKGARSRPGRACGAP